MEKQDKRLSEYEAVDTEFTKTALIVGIVIVICLMIADLIFNKEKSFTIFLFSLI